MADVLGWVPAPDDEVLLPGHCGARDEDGQGCTHGVVHLSPHQHTGLRAWLEAGTAGAIIRAYPAVDSDRLEGMEAALLARYQFVPVARQDLVHSEDGGVSWGWAMVVGPVFAPTARVTVQLRLVCFARLDPVPA